MIFEFKPKRPSRGQLWRRYYKKNLIALDIKKIVDGDQAERQKLLKAVHSGFKMVRHKSHKVEDLEMLGGLLGLLMPFELVILFPITKYYDGEKSQSKDYWYTVNYLKTLDDSQRIGEQTTDFDLSWDYVNPEIRGYGVAVMGLLSDKCREDKKLNPFYAFMKGLDLNGKPVKQIPDYLRLMEKPSKSP
ncbi:MAG: hypothetical protein FWF59_09615 [Turicibacter sp.]|nr:hypothetical protein [Turicibacter sp.]